MSTSSGGDGESELDFDLVVVGCGVAGSAAAAAALEEAASLGRRLRVLVLERSGPEMRGGNSRWTAAYLRMTDIDTPAPGFVDDLVAHAGGRVDPAYAQRLADQAGPTLRWLVAKGVDFEELPTMFLTQARPRLLPVGGGRVVLDTLLTAATDAGASIAYRSTAWKLSLADDGSVDGLWVRGADGYSARGTVKAVVIAPVGSRAAPR